MRLKTDLAEVLGVPEGAVRMVAADVGGNYGTRNSSYPEFSLVVWAAKRLRRPVPHREKAPIIQGWQTLRIGTDDLPHYFNSEPLNVSVLLGDASAGLVDIDLDAAETLPLAALVLPATAAKFGRASKPASHWLCTASPLARTEKFQEPREPGGDNEKTVMLVELRSNGCQTVFPGSTHPTGEEVRWDQDDEPAGVDGAVLRDRGRQLVGPQEVPGGDKMMLHWQAYVLNATENMIAKATPAGKAALVARLRAFLAALELEEPAP